MAPPAPANGLPMPRGQGSSAKRQDDAPAAASRQTKCISAQKVITPQHCIQAPLCISAEVKHYQLIPARIEHLKSYVCITVLTEHLVSLALSCQAIATGVDTTFCRASSKQ